ncbi:hypothetical protein ACTXLO_14390 [Psychrobacter alimentarius]|uniref:hypothetical protein n=1 Tax=Psychrobacter alimentarius TaxID=261164 RepID=UPI003FD29210
MSCVFNVSWQVVTLRHESLVGWVIGVGKTMLDVLHVFPCVDAALINVMDIGLKGAAML